MSIINKLIKQCRDRLAEFEPDFKIPMPLIFKASRKAPNKKQVCIACYVAELLLFKTDVNLMDEGKDNNCRAFFKIKRGRL
jgi:hypothetical protein